MTDDFGSSNGGCLYEYESEGRQDERHRWWGDGSYWDGHASGDWGGDGCPMKGDDGAARDDSLGQADNPDGDCAPDRDE